MRIAVLAAWFAVCWSAPAAAQELVYTPINPSFGGSPLNSSHLLGVANAQNPYSAPDRPSATQAESFRRQLESRLLSAATRSIANTIFDEESPPTGRFEFQGQVIEYERREDLTRIVITDLATGGQTVIEIPNDPNGIF